MKIKYRIFTGFSILFALGYSFLIYWTLNDVSIQPKKAMEESMLDTAYLLSGFLELDIKEEGISISHLADAFNNARKKKFTAQIYELKKSDINLDVYVTDKNGKVIFDSDSGRRVGEDFSDWNDVSLTLDGKYGARTTREIPGDASSNAAYVAAPVCYEGEIIGVCTVIKPWTSVTAFIQATRRKIIILATLGFLLVLLLSLYVSHWITRPISELTEYARSAQYGVRSELPGLGQNEIQDLGEAFEEMRESLEGKKYVENYIQTLTHQLKGPLSSIYGAAELLQEDLDKEDRDKFIGNISREAARIRRIVDRLLELASIEQRRSLQKTEQVNFLELVEEIVDGMAVKLEKKNITCTTIINKSFSFKGEKFLMRQALSNLVHNAVDFTPEGGEVVITVERDEKKKQFILSVEDSGSGIPEYAVGRIFERFYSLPRPGNGRKSSGLGLFLVKEVAQLHGGSVTLRNNQVKGATAILRLPY